jgi:plastocyanin
VTRLLILVLAALAVAIPALASAKPRAPGAIVAADYAFTNPAGDGSSVTIAAGETVSFSYPAGANFHNVVFGGSGPTACTPPLPEFPAEPGWQGVCRFNAPGTYEFVCGAHDFMTGTVVVTGDATPMPTTTATASPSSTPVASTTPPPMPSATATPTATPVPTEPPATTNPAPFIPAPSVPAASALKVAATQKGRSVKGSLKIAQASSRLKVDVLRGKSRLASSTKTVKQGTATFALKLKRQAKTVKLTVKIAVTPPSGAIFTATTTVTLTR